MVEFYRNLWVKKLGKLQALRQAQLAMLRRDDPQAGQLRGANSRGPDSIKRDRPSDPAQRLSPFYWVLFS